MGYCKRANRTGRSGAILVMALLGMTLLVSLIFYVYNVGDQVNTRLALQNASDSTAISGAGWMARSANTTAMNNVAISRLLGILPVMDSFPLCSKMALEEVTEWEQGLRNQAAALRVFLNEVPDPALATTIDGMLELQARMATQRDILAPFKAALLDGGFDMESATNWRKSGSGGSVPHGTIWQAAVALDNYSQATMDASGLLAQFNAGRFGKANGAETAILVPIIPEIPNYRGTLDDFQPTLEGRITVRTDGDSTSGRMVRTGSSGGAIPDYAYHHRLGPWARLLPRHVARWEEKRVTASRWVPGSTPSRNPIQARGGRGGLPGRGHSARRGSRSGRGVGNGHYVPTAWEVNGYSTRGPYWWAMRRVHDYARGNQRYDDYDADLNNNHGKLPDTNFYEYMKTVSRIKLDYMFPASAGTQAGKLIHYPLWKTNYIEALELAETDVVRIKETILYYFDIASSVSSDSPEFMTPGTYITNGSLALAAHHRGWRDPKIFRPDAVQICNFIWKSKDQYEITEYPEIGIRREEIQDGKKVDEDGNPIMIAKFHPVYMVEFCMFGGIDVGGEVEVANPCNWSSGDQEDLPSPLLIDTDKGDYDPENRDVDGGVRREYFAYLGMARNPSEAQVWADKFTGANPTKAIHTLSQAKVFNNKSWGLWTQDWQVQLTSLNGFPDWVDRLNNDVEQGKASRTENAVRASDLESILEFLQALASGNLAGKFFVH
jgi:hypothetical protein